MKFLPLRDFDVVTSALNFDTPDCHVTGGCDLYTTKAAGGDKKLYKNIDKSLESQHEAMLKFGASLSPPQRSTLNLSRSSPFGPLSNTSSRKTFAYLIATLNASHPDYDFSHNLRPSDFKRERPLRKVATNLDTMLYSARPGVAPTVEYPVSAYMGNGRKSKRALAAASGMGSSPPAVSGAQSPAWGPHMWALIDKEMTLKDCSIWSYQPVNNSFDEEASAIWTMHYFFFNKERKRVAYLHARGVPVVSHNTSPQTRQRSGAVSITPCSSSGDLRKRRLGGMTDEAGANKRARFWLGDRAEQVSVNDDEFDADDDGLEWNRDSNGVLPLDKFAGVYDETYDEEDFDEVEDDFSEEEADDEAEYNDDDARTSQGPIRHMSEEVAGPMEIE